MKCRNLMVFDWIINSHNTPMQVISVGEDYAYADFEGNEGDLFGLSLVKDFRKAMEE